MSEGENNQLPKWARVAFIVRCARRLLAEYEDYKDEPLFARTVTKQAISVAESRSNFGGDADYYEGGGDDGAIRVDGQFFDHYDLDALWAALHAIDQGANSTYLELEEDPEAERYCALICGVVVLAKSAFCASFGAEHFINATASSDDQIKEAVELCKFARPEILTAVTSDLHRMHQLAVLRNWTDYTPVSQSQFG